jgi:HMG (high mobility group) box
MLNPYIAFSMDERKKIVAENPSLKSDIGKVAKMVGERWRKLSDGEKAKFKGRAGKKSTRKAKKVVEVEEEVEVKKGKKAKRKGTRKLSGYMKFVQSERKNVIKSNPNMAFGAVGKELGKRWGALSDAQKKSYA